jgi:hypothetical protein
VANKQKEVKDGTHTKRTLEQLVDHLIERSVTALENKTLKVTVTDLMRIRELQKEVAPNPMARPGALWVDYWD